MSLRAFKMVITTSATRRVCTCCQSGAGLASEEERALSGMAPVCNPTAGPVIVETT
jgi:hypothetical protein